MEWCYFLYGVTSDLKNKMPVDELTNERLESQDKKFTLMLEQNKEEHKEIRDSMKDWFSHQDSRFDQVILMIEKMWESKANKWVESFLIWAWRVIWGLALWVIVAVFIRALIVFYETR